MRRFSSTSTSAADTGRPAGMPSRIPTRPRPCDSPAVVNRKVIPASFSYITAEPDLGRARLLHIPDAVRSGTPGSRRHRQRVGNRRQLQDQEPGRRNSKQQLVPAYVARDPQRPDDRIADGDRPKETAEVRVEHVDVAVRVRREYQTLVLVGPAAAVCAARRTLPTRREVVEIVHIHAGRERGRPGG